METNPLGYPVLNKKNAKKIFGNLKPKNFDPWGIENAKRNLKKFGIPVPVYSEEVWEGDLPVPPLKGEDIFSHFDNVANEQVGRFIKYGDELKSNRVQVDFNLLYHNNISPSFKTFVDTLLDHVKGGVWLRAEPVVIEDGEVFLFLDHVDTPTEPGFIFDTETFVKYKNYPIIGTACSHKAIYLWIASELLDPSLPKEQWDQFNFINVGTDNFIVAHNAAFDRTRTQAAYQLNKLGPDNFWFDTQSAHIAVSGLASGQRWLYALNGKDPSLLSAAEKRKLRYKPEWLGEGSTNSLVEVYNFHVAQPKFLLNPDTKFLGDEDKETRDIFVLSETLQEIKDQLYVAVEYAIKDSLYTHELFQVLWGNYKETTPSKIAFVGHYHLGASKVPLVPDWEEWKEEAEKVWESRNQQMEDNVKAIAKKEFEKWQKSVLDEKAGVVKYIHSDYPKFMPLLFGFKTMEEQIEFVEEYAHIDKFIRNFLNKKGEWTFKWVKGSNKFKRPDLDKHILKWLELLGFDWHPKTTKMIDDDSWMRQLDWKFTTTGTYAYKPNWYRKFQEKTVSTKNRTAHLLLRLKWDGKPILFTKDKGWCYDDGN